jgi:hypothetical protein
VHLVPDRLRLPRVLTAADDEEVGVAADRPHVEDHNLASELLLGEAGDAARVFERGQSVVVLSSSSVV